jgi:uncharacterized protein
MRVVCNSGPIIWLSRIDRFSLLRDLFGEVVIPPAAYAETVLRAEGYPNAVNVQAAIDAGWIMVTPALESGGVARLQARLDSGEAETLVVALELEADVVLIDDRRGRRVAAELGLTPMGTAGVLLLAHDRGVAVDVKATIDEMRSLGFRLSNQAYQEIIHRTPE